MSLDPRDEWLDPDDEPAYDHRAPGEDRPPAYADGGGFPAPRAFPQFQADRPPVIQPQIVRGGAGRDRGCWLPALALSLIVGALVLIGLFLPPVSLWDTLDDAINGEPTAEGGAAVDSVQLTADSPRLDQDGLVIETAPDALAGDYRVYVASLDPADYLAEQTPAEGWYCEADLPPSHALASRVYSLGQSGTAPAALTVQVTALADAQAGDQAAALLRLYEWNAASGEWDFLPGQTSAGPDTQAVQVSYLPRCVALFRVPPSERQLGVTMAVGDTFQPDVMAAHVRAYPAGLRPTATGALQGVLAAGFEVGQGYDVLPLISNFDDPAVIDVATVQTILSNPALRQEHALQVAAFVLRDDAGYAGVLIDYREIPTDLRDAYTAFVRELAALLHGQSRTLMIALPPPALDPNTQTWDGGAYDWAGIGQAADAVVAEMPLAPSIFLADGMADRLLAWATSQITPDRLYLGLSALSAEEQSGGVVVPATPGAAWAGVQLEPAGPAAPGEMVTARLAAPEGLQVQTGQDETTGAPYLRYVDAQGSPVRTLWITTPAVLRARMDRAAQYELAGVVVRNAMAAGAAPGIGEALLSYQLGEPQAETATTLAWIARAGEVNLVEAEGDTFSFQVPAEADVVTVEVRYGIFPVGSASITVAAAEPEAAPTEPPAEQPTATPEPTEALPTEPAPEAAAQSPADSVPPVPDLTVPTVDPAAFAGASAGFEAGVYVRQLNATSILATGRAHFDWMAFEVTYHPGADPAEQQRALEDAQANGFKVLFSVSGDAADLAGADQAGYLNQYAQYVAGLATLGADGVEVWPGMNAAHITPEAYVQLLGLAASAIKTANPNTLVVTGGPASIAPGGQDTAFTWTTDDTYTSLAGAGAAAYADCIGVQYTLGALPPDATGGDVRGGASFYFLPTLLDVAANAFPGTPLCVTRLGYLTPQGFDALPAGYEWAQSTTTDQQAQWLASAVQSLAGRAGVRLALVWTMDGAGLDETSVAGGYAMLRPDGTCPACDALEPVLK